MTVVVATRNRREQLLRFLPRHAAPVIVVDNGSTDGTAEAVRAAHPGIRVVELGDNAGAAARNIGVRLARTPFVAFADDDSYWRPGSLDLAATLLRRHPEAGLLAARVLVGPGQRLDPVSAAMAEAPLGSPPHRPGPPVLGFLGCAAVVRRAAFLAVGGFHPGLRVYGEEELLALDLAAAGWQLSYVPSLVAHHHPRPTGRNPAARNRLEARNRLLTAVLRRPVRVVLRSAVQALRDPAGRGGLAAAARELGWAVRQRRPLPRPVEAARDHLDRLNRRQVPAGGAAARSRPARLPGRALG